MRNNRLPTSPSHSAFRIQHSAFQRGSFFVPLLLLVLAVAGVLRLYGFDWGEGQQLHPDEIGITTAALQRVTWPAGTTLDSLLDPARSPLNPRAGGAAYPYGTLPIYLGKAVASVATAGDYQGILLTGRVLAGLFDTATVLLVFLLGARLWGRRWGLFAAALYALGVLPIQLAHFYISEPFMAFFMAAALLFSLLYYQDGRFWAILLASLSCGLALACKLSAAPVLALPFAALLLGELSSKDGTRTSPRNVLRLCLVTLAGAVAGLFIGDPYALLDAPTYLRQVADQAQIQSGAADVWFTRRYVGTWPVLYPWWQLVLLGVGPLVGLTGSAGAMIAIARSRRRDWSSALLLVGALVYFASIAFLEAKWVRYLLPLIPYLCLFTVMAVKWLAELRTAARNAKRETRNANEQDALRTTHYASPPSSVSTIAVMLTTVLIVSAALGAVAFTAVYRHEHTLVQASRWLFTNVPPGGKIGVEINDGVLPLPLSGYPNPEKEYNITSLRMLADFPSEQASAYLRDGLHNIDYLVVGSIRAVRTVPKMPWRYPVQERYYELLFAGKLGFSPVFTAASYPSILGLHIPDDNDWFDASFIEYDHPTVRIFKRDRDLSKQEWDALFVGAVNQPSVATRTAP